MNPPPDRQLNTGDPVPINARKRHRVDTGGPWGSGLLLLGLAALAQGLSYSTGLGANMTPPLRALSQWTPMPVWGLLWVVAGLIVAWKALRPPQHHHDVWPIVAMIAVWSAAYLVHWLTGGLFNGEWSRQWAPGLAWAFLGAWVVCWARCVNPPTVAAQ